MHRAPGPPISRVPSAEPGHQLSEPPRRPGSPRLPPLHSPPRRLTRCAAPGARTRRADQGKRSRRTADRAADAAILTPWWAGQDGAGGLRGRAGAGQFHPPPAGGAVGQHKLYCHSPGAVRNEDVPGWKGPTESNCAPCTGQAQQSHRVSESVVQALLDLWQVWGLVLMIPLSVPQSSAVGKPFCCRYPIMARFSKHRAWPSGCSVSCHGRIPARCGSFSCSGPFRQGWPRALCFLRHRPALAGEIPRPE